MKKSILEEEVVEEEDVEKVEEVEEVELDQIYSEDVEDYLQEMLTDNQLLLAVLSRVSTDSEDEMLIVLRTIAKEELKKMYMQ